VLLAGAIRSWRARTLHRGTLWLLAGAAVVHVLVLSYFAIAMGDALYYVRAWFARQGEVEAIVPRPFPHNLVRFALYVTWGGAFGNRAADCGRVGRALAAPRRRATRTPHPARRARDRAAPHRPPRLAMGRVDHALPVATHAGVSRPRSRGPGDGMARGIGRRA